MRDLPSTTAAAPGPAAVGKRPDAASLAPLVLARTFATCGRHALPLAGLAFVSGGAPVLLAVAWVAVVEEGGLGIGSPMTDEQMGLLMLALWLPFTAVQAGAATQGTLRALRGEPFGFGASLGAGLRRLPAVLVASVISGIAIFAGLSVLFAPGMVALAALAVSVPAAVAERKGGLRALVRSLDLTRGERGGLFGALAVLLAVAVVTAGAAIAATADRHPAFGAAYPILIALVTQLLVVGCAVAYVELRDRKEGAPATDLEKIFE